MKIAKSDAIALHLRAVNVGMVAAIVTLLVFLALSGCASTWCEDNPRSCKAAIIGAEVVGVCVVTGIAMSASRTGARTSTMPASAPIAPVVPNPCSNTIGWGCAR